MKSYEYILFDWDGNLVKTLDVWLIATKAPLENRGVQVSDKTGKLLK
jgi:beta-phosphoglucomutase-like phosphatase (HAD superfamily)